MLGQNTGWICPHCNKANAPWMPYCCNGNNLKNIGIDLGVMTDSVTQTLQLCPHGIPVKFCFQCKAGVLKNATGEIKI